ncbi:MAG: integrase arm-type DNA-binding domain-containing protein, partial [Pseudomonadota bacterium]|nr:integrase arm-type DNA-binding domain-containing protein [Pseudomonadota bacterium]
MAGLTDAKIAKLKPTEEPYKRAIGKGLSILVTPAGGKLWRFRWRGDNGKERMLSLGVFPDTSLEDAEGKRDKARKLIEAGGDPAAERRAGKLADANTFEAVARECVEKRLAGRSAGTIERAEWMLESFIYPYIGSKPLDKIEPPDVLAALRRVEARGRHETARRTRQRVSMVFRYGVATGRCKRDITA